MRLDDITDLFYLSCVLFFFYVNSQSSCPSGWFGSECKYKCRCTDNNCDDVGACAETSNCQGGWFGPACQFVDMAYNASNIKALTDGNDSTCNTVTGLVKLVIPLQESIMFTWLRVHVTDQVSDSLSKLQMTLSYKGADVKCPDLKAHAVDTRTFEMHCISEDQINTITLNGDAVSSLCSVYVSGGRNVALKEKTNQGNTYSIMVAGVYTTYWAALAVDGDTRQVFSEGACSRTIDTLNWGLTFSKPRRVYRYFIFNRSDGYMDLLAGFRLESFDQMNKSVFVYKDPSTQGSPNYMIIHTPRSIQTISILAYNSVKVLNICEFEAYGDSICADGSFGFDCERSCHCLNGEACFASNGFCPSGCASGFSGIGCYTICKVGMFGENCKMTCSEGCQPADNANITSCNAVTGHCLKGCLPGYLGSGCFDTCKVRMFGRYCNMTCNEHCKPTGDSNLTSCNVSTGECLRGCQPGFTGSRCLDSCEVGKYGKDCNMTCSEHCNPTGDPNMTSCDVTNGKCLKGCQPGFTENSYSECCTVGMFGEDCNETCSEHCQPTSDPNLPYCNASTGECLNGCKAGFSGNGCLDTAAGAAAGAETGMFSLDLITGTCVFLALLLLLSYCFYPRKKAKPTGELAAANTHISASPEGL